MGCLGYFGELITPSMWFKEYKPDVPALLEVFRRVQAEKEIDAIVLGHGSPVSEQCTERWVTAVLANKRFARFIAAYGQPWRQLVAGSGTKYVAALPEPVEPAAAVGGEAAEVAEPVAAAE